MSIMKTAAHITDAAIKSGRALAGQLSNWVPSKDTVIAFAVIISITLVGASNSHGQVFDVNAIDGSIGQPSLLDANTLAYGLQPFPVTTALTSADSIQYNAAFSTDPVALPNSNLTGLDVRTWDAAFIYISNLADALNGTPTASFEFNPLESTAVNGQQFQDLITMQQGENGETHYNFVSVANLGVSTDGNNHHQITETFDMDTIVTLQDSTTTTLRQFLTANVGQTLYAGSVISNGTSEGSYEIAATSNLGQDGVLFVPQGGFQLDVGFAHQISAMTDEPSIVLGDINGDSSVNFLDISPFIVVLSSGEFQTEADINQDGNVNFLDISPFINILSAQ